MSRAIAIHSGIGLVKFSNLDAQVLRVLRLYYMKRASETQNRAFSVDVKMNNDSYILKENDIWLYIETCRDINISVS